MSSAEIPTGIFLMTRPAAGSTTATASSDSSPTKSTCPVPCGSAPPSVPDPPLAQPAATRTARIVLQRRFMKLPPIVPASGDQDDDDDEERDDDERGHLETDGLRAPLLPETAFDRSRLLGGPMELVSLELMHPPLDAVQVHSTDLRRSLHFGPRQQSAQRRTILFFGDLHRRSAVHLLLGYRRRDPGQRPEKGDPHYPARHVHRAPPR